MKEDWKWALAYDAHIPAGSKEIEILSHLIAFNLLDRKR